jgi:hypothetical protein
MRFTCHDLEISSPWMNVAGALGFAPPQPGRWTCRWGFYHQPGQPRPAHPAHNRALAPYAGGFLLHTGLPNPGLRQVLQRYAARWAQGNLPVWVHLLASTPDEVHKMALELENQPGVAAIELGIPPYCLEADARALVEAATGELPLIVQVGLNEVYLPWVRDLLVMGVRGSAWQPRAAPCGRKNPCQRAYDRPRSFPLVMGNPPQLDSLDLPLIAGCGVYSRAAGERLLSSAPALCRWIRCLGREGKVTGKR